MNDSKLIADIDEIDSSVQDILLEGAVSLNNKGNGWELNLSQLEKLGYTKEACIDLLGLFLHILKYYAKNDSKEFSKSMLADGYPELFVQKCVSKLSSLHLTTLKLDKLLSFKWRLDISYFDNKSLKKIPVPVIISLRVSNGKKVTIEINVRAFHKLRFAVAYLVSELLAIKSMSQLKL